MILSLSRLVRLVGLVFSLLPALPAVLAAQVAAAVPISPVQPAAASASVDASRYQLPATDEGLPGAGPIRRADWFKKMWSDRRVSFAARAAQDRGALVFLGDSITQGWGNQLGAMFPGVRIANRGISGDTSRGVLMRLEEDVISLQPRGVVLLIGTNDLEDQATPETIQGNFKLILAALKRHNAALPVVLCQVFPSSDAKKRPAAQIKALNQLYFAAIKDEPQVTVLDTWSLFATPQGDAAPVEFPDLLHPNGLGYARWAAALRPTLEILGLVPSWPDEFTPESGFEAIFNGRDLAGWGYPGQPPLAARNTTEDGRFLASPGRLVVTASRLERNYLKLATTREFNSDFVLRLEFRASPAADSGVFIRNTQLQVRDYLVAGPYHTLKHYRPLEWNEIEVVVRGGLAHATCNGEVLVEAMPVAATGSIGIESDRGQVEYRRIRVRESASKRATP